MKAKETSRSPHRQFISTTEAAILGLAGFVLLAVLLANLLISHRSLVPEAQNWDLARIKSYLAMSKMTLEAQSRGVPDEVSLQELRDLDLHVDVFPPEKVIPQPNPRYVPALGCVEAWDVINGINGEPLAVIRLARFDIMTRRSIETIRLFTLTAAVGGIFLIGTMWLVLRRTVFRRIEKFSEAIEASLPRGSAPATRDPLDRLEHFIDHATTTNSTAAKRIRQLLDGHSEIACLGTTEGTLLEVNAAYCRLFGKTREQLVGTNYLDLIPPADRTDAVNNLRKLSHRTPESTVEHRVLLDDGSVRWMRWRDTAVLDAAGQVQESLSFGLDITAEKNLAEHGDNLRRAFDQMQSLAQTGSLTWNLTTDHMDWTMETRRLLGLDGETPSLESLLAIVSSGDREPLRALLHRAREFGTAFEHEFRVLSPGGTRRTLQSRAEVRADPQTKLLNQLTCTLRDITALRDAEAALRRELHFREAVEQSLAAGIVVSDDAGRIRSVNPAFCALTGWSAEELVGLHPPYPYWPEEEMPAIRAAFALATSRQTPPGGFELRFGRKDGTRFDVLVNVAPLLDSDDRQLGLLGAVTDISAIQQTRRDLQTTNERLQLAQDVVEFGIWDWNPVQDKLFWDRPSFTLFGHPEATDAEAVWAAVLPEDERERLTYELQRLIASGGKSGQDLLRIQWPDGSLHDISSTYIIIRDDHRKATRIFGVNRDVTGEFEAERELRDANERLAAALEGGQFGTFEHLIGRGDYNWNPANYEINGIDPSITDPAELFTAWKKVTGGFFPQLMANMAALPATQTSYTYEFTAHPAGREPRHVRVSIFIERNKQGHPVRLVGITRLVG